MHPLTALSSHKTQSTGGLKVFGATPPPLKGVGRRRQAGRVGAPGQGGSTLPPPPLYISRLVAPPNIFLRTKSKQEGKYFESIRFYLTFCMPIRRRRLKGTASQFFNIGTQSLLSASTKMISNS